MLFAFSPMRIISKSSRQLLSLDFRIFHGSFHSFISLPPSLLSLPSSFSPSISLSPPLPLHLPFYLPSLSLSPLSLPPLPSPLPSSPLSLCLYNHFSCSTMLLSLVISFSISLCLTSHTNAYKPISSQPALQSFHHLRSA